MIFEAVSALVLAIAPVSTPYPVAAAGKDPSERKICRKVPSTGSLVKHTKVCMTQRQWNKSAKGHRISAEDMVQGTGTTPRGAQ